MPALGEWDAPGDAPAAGPEGASAPVPEALAEQVAISVAGLDLGEVTGRLVGATVQSLITAEVKKVASPIVQAAVAEVFTPERIAALEQTAAQAARQAVEPDPVEAEPAETDPEVEPAPQLYYGSVDEFVREMIVPVFSRKVGERAERRWSGRWWESTEAVIRLEALWRSWEHLRLDPSTGMSVWLRDHLDHHLGVLMAPGGPFDLSEDSAKVGEPLPYAPPPAGLFTDVRQTDPHPT